MHTAVKCRTVYMQQYQIGIVYYPTGKLSYSANESGSEERECFKTENREYDLPHTLEQCIMADHIPGNCILKHSLTQLQRYRFYSLSLIYIQPVQGAEDCPDGSLGNIGTYTDTKGGFSV